MRKSECAAPTLNGLNQAQAILTDLTDLTDLMILDIHPPIVKTFDWPDEAATAAFAEQLAQHTRLTDAFIALRGDLGAGKTTFVRYLLAALGVQGRIKSPTYAVVEPYTLAPSGAAVWHFDFYRFNDPREWEEAGFRDIFASPGLKLVEWPDNAGEHLPQPDWVMTIESLTDSARRVRVEAITATGQALLA